jgi:hypothetical protein
MPALVSKHGCTLCIISRVMLVPASRHLTPAPCAAHHHQVSELWDSFTGQLHQYDGHLAEQREQLQAVTLRQVEEFKGRLAGFASRCASRALIAAPARGAAKQLALRHVVSCC